MRLAYTLDRNDSDKTGGEARRRPVNIANVIIIYPAMRGIIEAMLMTVIMVVRVERLPVPLRCM